MRHAHFWLDGKGPNEEELPPTRRTPLEKFAAIATLEEIAGENDYNLNISRYVDSTEPPPQLDVKGELRKLRDLERTRNEAEQRMNTLLEEVDMPSENGLPPGWGKFRIRDVADTYSGGTPDRANAAYFGGTIPWVKSGEVNLYKVHDAEEFLTDEGLKSSSAKWVPKDSVLAAMYGATAGKFAWLSINATINQAVLAIRAKETLADNKFLFHLLHWMGPQLLNNLQGSGQPNLNGELINSVEVLIPPLDEQRKLITIFDAIDDATDRTRAVIHQTHKVKTALLQDLLTNGLPGRHNKYSNDKKVGRYPADWRLVPLDDLNDDGRPICYGILMPGRGYPGGVPVVKVKDIRGGQIDESDILLTSPELDEEYRRSRLRTGDLLMTIRGSTGRVAIVPRRSTGQTSRKIRRGCRSPTRHP